MQLRYRMFTKYLSEREREEGIMLRYLPAAETYPVKQRLCVPSSSLPSACGSLGVAPFKRVVNEKRACSFPSRSGCSVSSSSNTSPWAEAATRFSVSRNHALQQSFIVTANFSNQPSKHNPEPERSEWERKPSRRNCTGEERSVHCQ